MLTPDGPALPEALNRARLFARSGESPGAGLGVVLEPDAEGVRAEGRGCGVDVLGVGRLAVIVDIFATYMTGDGRMRGEGICNS
jgi:hypothetical protein